MVFDNMPVEAEPFVARAPDHPPAATHDAASVVAHVNVELAPLAMVLGSAVSDTVGAGEATVTAAVCEADPPGPVHVSVKSVVAVNAGVVSDPLVAILPLHPSEAAQDVASVELQVSIELAPTPMETGEAESNTVGPVATLATSTALPLAELSLLPPQPDSAANSAQLTAINARRRAIRLGTGKLRNRIS